MASDDNLIEGFKKFILRGNVVDLAVAVVLGTAFGLLIKAIVDNLVNPLIQAIFGKPDMTNVLAFDVNNAHFSFGAILGAAINFVAVAAVVYFVVVIPLNKLLARYSPPEVVEAKLDPELVLLGEIRDLLAGTP